MNELIGLTLHALILLAMIFATWKFPRTFGLLGMLAAHLFCVFAMIIMGYVSFTFGVWPFPYEPEILIGHILQAVIFNSAMLPLSIWAMIRWRKLSPLSRDYAGGPTCPKDQNTLTRDGG